MFLFWSNNCVGINRTCGFFAKKLAFFSYLCNQNISKMRVVSKFSITYIVFGILLLIIPLLVAFMFCFCTEFVSSSEDNELVFDQESIIRFSIASIGIFALVFYKFGKYVRITATEDYISFYNLITRRIKYIKYYEIADVVREIKTGEGGGRLSWHYATYETFTYIVLKNGKIIHFNDFPYDDFDEVENFILENYNKTKGISINLPHNDIENVFSKAKFRSMIETSSSIFKNAK